MRRAALACLVTLLVVLSVGASIAEAAPRSLQASIAPEATLVDGGSAALLSVTVSCAGGSDVLEAFVYVTQDGLQSSFAPIPVHCGGTRAYTVRVAAPAGTTFHVGTASASGYVLVDRKGTTSSTSPSQTLTMT